jgi:hypothetical protein
MFAGLALGLAAPASAEMSGHYIATQTNPAGQSTTNDWYVTPCGDGCASIVSGSQPLGQARLVNGQWTMDADADINCLDGTPVVRGGASNHYSWDPNTLAGIIQTTYNVPACGQPGLPWHQQATNNLQLRQAA